MYIDLQGYLLAIQIPSNTPGTHTLILGIYNPPGDQQTNKLLQNETARLLALHNGPAILYGDFNARLTYEDYNSTDHIPSHATETVNIKNGSLRKIPTPSPK